MMIRYRQLQTDELRADYFASFRHEQCWHSQWKKVDGEWTLQPVNSLRSWSAKKRIWISEYLKEQIANGGFVIGAFSDDQIVGFLAVDGEIIESYMNLTMLFVDDSFHRRGIGKTLIELAREKAAAKGAEKLFISAVPSEETVAFYSAMGCKDAQCMISEFVDTEDDRYLELSL